MSYQITYNANTSVGDFHANWQFIQGVQPQNYYFQPEYVVGPPSYQAPDFVPIRQDAGYFFCPYVPLAPNSPVVINPFYDLTTEQGREASRINMATILDDYLTHEVNRGAKSARINWRKEGF